MSLTVEVFPLPSGLTLTVQLYPLDSDTIANGADGDSLVEATNRKGLYRATVAEAITGWHTAHVMLGSTPIGGGWVYLAAGQVCRVAGPEASIVVAAEEPAPPVPTPSTPPFVTGRYLAYYEGLPQAGQTIELQLHTLPAGDVGAAYDRDYSETTAGDGTCDFVGLVEGAVYLARRNSGPWRRITIPEDEDGDGVVDLTSIFGP